jgi:hypothetical protein
LVGRTGEVEEQVLAFLFHAHMQAHGRIEIDPIAVDEALALADAVGPGGDFSAHLGFRQCKQLLKRAENRFFAVALHHLLKAIFAKPRGADLAAQIAYHQFRSAAVGAENGFDVFAGLIFVNELDRRHVKAFLVDLSGLAPAASGYGTADVAFVREVGRKANPLAAEKYRRQHGHIGSMRAAT